MIIKLSLKIISLNSLKCFNSTCQIVEFHCNLVLNMHSSGPLQMPRDIQWKCVLPELPHLRLLWTMNSGAFPVHMTLVLLQKLNGFTVKNKDFCIFLPPFLNMFVKINMSLVFNFQNVLFLKLLFEVLFLFAK